MRDLILVRQRAVVSIVFTLFLSTFCGGVCFSAEWHVHASGNGDYPNIQDAVDKAEANDTILLSDGQFTGARNTNIDFGGKDLVVKSISGDPSNCVIDCSSDLETPVSRGFIFQNGETSRSKIVGITIRLGQARGEKIPHDRGGAIRISNSSPTISSCVFVGNSASAGGAISFNNSSSIIQDCRFEQNTAIRGGAIFIFKSTTTIESNGFFNNSATYGGAAMSKNTLTEFVDCRLESNLGERGGALFVESCPNFSLIRCFVSKNMAVLGGGVYTTKSKFLLANSIVAQNSAGSGGGVHGQDDSVLKIESSMIVSNTQGEAVALGALSKVDASCSLIFGNWDGDWVGALEDQASQRENLSINPQLREFEQSEFGIVFESPALASDSCMSDGLRWILND
jgi:hypothetical protein